MAMSALRLDDPMRFLKHNFESAGRYNLPDPVSGLFDSLMQNNPLWVAPLAVLGLAEMWRQRHRPAARCYALLALFVLNWTIYRLWAHQMTIRFTWDAVLLLALPATLAIERVMNGRHGVALRWAGLVAVAACALEHRSAIELQANYVPRGLRTFAGMVQNRTGTANILVFDHLEPAVTRDLHLFRTAIVQERLVNSDWLDPDCRVTPDAMSLNRIRFILARRPPGALAAGGPLLVESSSGWQLWEACLASETNGKE
jgi:hypothetical protein